MTAMAIFQDRTCRTTIFPTFVRLMRGLQDAHALQNVRPVCRQHGMGSQADCDSRALPWKKTYDIVGRTYDIVCMHAMSVFTTTSHVTLRYRRSGIRYRMSKKWPTMSYTICTYDVVGTPPTIQCVFLNLRYRIRYIFIVTYDIVCT
jgi:hypothetical protein